jgi:hypothetical protein
MDRNDLLVDPRHVGILSGASKMICQPMVLLAQTIHLACAEMNTISRQTEMSFQLTHIT